VKATKISSREYALSKWEWAAHTPSVCHRPECPGLFDLGHFAGTCVLSDDKNCLQTCKSISIPSNANERELTKTIQKSVVQ